MHLKRKITIVTIVFSVLTLLFTLYAPDLSTFSFEETPDKNTFVTVEPLSSPPEVYFCPTELCEDELASFILSAQESVYCAFYDLDLEKVTAALEEVDAEVDVVIDQDNEEEYNNSFVTVNTASGLMHHKFCVVDERKVSTGSFNPTERGAYLNDNNLVIVESPTLARNFINEFFEVKDNLKRSNKSTVTHVQLGGMLVENYFCPEDSCIDRVVESLQKAEQSIYFMTFSFTHERVATTLAMKNEEGVEIKGVMEARQVTKYSQFEFLNFQGIEVYRDGNKGNLHHKVFIIDNKTVITGSFNPSKNADKRNDENILIIHDVDVASEFLEEFERVWEEALLKNKTS